jgi:hypothetical protein
LGILGIIGWGLGRLNVALALALGIIIKVGVRVNRDFCNLIFGLATKYTCLVNRTLITCLENEVFLIECRAA